MSLLILIFLINAAEMKPLADSDSLEVGTSGVTTSEEVKVYSYGMDEYSVGFNKNSISTNTVEEKIDVSSGQLTLNIKLTSLPMRGNKTYDVYLTYKGSPISVSEMFGQDYGWDGLRGVEENIDDNECIINADMGNCGLGWNIMPGEFSFRDWPVPRISAGAGVVYEGFLNLNGGRSYSMLAVGTGGTPPGRWNTVDKREDLLLDGIFGAGEGYNNANLYTPEYDYFFGEYGSWPLADVTDWTSGDRVFVLLTKITDKNGNQVTIDWHEPEYVVGYGVVITSNRVPEKITTPTDECNIYRQEIIPDGSRLWNFYTIERLEEDINGDLFTVRFYYEKENLPDAFEFWYGHEVVLLDSIVFLKNGTKIKPSYRFFYDRNNGELTSFITPDGAEYSYEYESVKGDCQGGRTEYRRINRKEVVLPDDSKTLVYEYHYEGGTDIMASSVGEKQGADGSWSLNNNLYDAYTFYPMYKKCAVILPEGDSVVYWNMNNTYRTEQLEQYLDGSKTQHVYPDYLGSFYGRPYKIVTYDKDDGALKMERLYWTMNEEVNRNGYYYWNLHPVLKYKITQKNPDNTIVEDTDENLMLYEYTKYDKYDNKKKYKFIGEIEYTGTEAFTAEYTSYETWIDKKGRLLYNDKDPEDSWVVEQEFKHEEDPTYIREEFDCGVGCIEIRWHQLVHLLTSKGKYTISGEKIDSTELEYDLGILVVPECGVDLIPLFDKDNYGGDFTIRGNLTEKTEWINEAETRSQRYHYDLCGNLRSMEDYRGYTYFFRYLLPDNVFPQDKSYPNALIERFVFDNEGNLRSFTDRSGIVDSFYYDIYGRLTEYWKGDPDDLKRLGLYQYYDFDRYAKEILYSSEGTRSNVTYYYYDELGRLEMSRRVPHLGDDIIKEYSYDDNGRLVEETVPRFSDASEVYYVTKDFDVLNRVTEIEYPSDGEDEYVTYEYEGDITDVYDEEGCYTTLINDASGNLIKVVDALYVDDTTCYDYDLNGNLLKITDTEGKEIDFEYDWLGNLVLRDGPDRGIDIFEYDENGNAKYHKDNSGDEIEFEYDELNRIEIKRVNNQVKETYYYDSYDNIGGDSYDAPEGLEYPEGRLTGFQNPNVTEVYFYDEFGNLAEKLILLSTGYVDTIEYSYDLKGRLTELQYPGGDYKVNYEYDNFDNISSIEINEGETVTFSSTAVGLLSTVDFPGGVTDAFTYKPRNWMDILRVDGASDSYWRKFEYNKRGELTGELYSLTNGDYAAEYTYDSLGRLTGEDRDGSENDHIFEYDKVGNRTRVNDNVYDYETGTNKLTDDGPNTYAYDYIGCISAKSNLVDGTTNFTYDPEGRLVFVELPGGEDGYKYYYKGLKRIREEKITDIEHTQTFEGVLYSCKLKWKNLPEAVLEAVFMSDENNEIGTLTLVSYVVLHGTHDWIRFSDIIPPEDLLPGTHTVKLRVRKVVSDPPRDSLWVGDMSIDLLWEDGGISGDVEQPSDYFYDNAGNLILVNSLGSGAAANVVQNPGFETGDLSGWSVCGGYGGGVSDDFDEYEGEYSLVFSGNGSVCQEISLSETVSSPITISCWVEISCFWGEASFELKGVLKGDGINEEHSTEIIAASCDWTQVSVTIDSIPEGTSSCEIKLIKVSGFGYVFVDNVVCELETEQEISTKYIYAGSRLLAKEEDGELFFYHLDRLGSPIMITEEDGDVVKEKKYEAFGNLIWAEGDYNDNREFTSKEKDPTGFHYFSARYYYGDIGRFLKPDPVSLNPDLLDLKHPKTLNPYVYCHNNPLNYLDLWGLWETHQEEDEYGPICVVDDPIIVTAPRYQGGVFSWGLPSMPYYGYSRSHSSSEFWRAQLPDYVSFAGNIGGVVGLGFQLTLDRYGNLYFAGTGNLAKSLTLVSGSLTAGAISKLNLISKIPTETQLLNFHSKHGFNVGGGALVGFQGDFVPGSGAGVQVGLYSPQVGGTYLYGGKIYKFENISW